MQTRAPGTWKARVSMMVTSQVLFNGFPCENIHVKYKDIKCNICIKIILIEKRIIIIRVADFS